MKHHDTPLAGYSLNQIVMAVYGPVTFLGAVIMLFVVPRDKNFPRWAIFAGSLGGACWTAANLLGGKTAWKELAGNLTIVGGVLVMVQSGTMIIKALQHKKHSNVPPQPQPAVPSDNVWPPPPTSPTLHP